MGEDLTGPSCGFGRDLIDRSLTDRRVGVIKVVEEIQREFPQSTLLVRPFDVIADRHVRLQSARLSALVVGWVS